MMKRSAQKNIVVGFGLILLLIGSLGWLSNRSTRQFIDNSRWVSHSHEVLEKLAEIRSLVKDVEIGQHGYLVTGNERYLESFEAARQEVGLALQDLQNLFSDDRGQREKLELVRRLVSQRILLSKQTIELCRSKGLQATANSVSIDRGKRTMDNLRKALAGLETEERALLKQRMNRAETCSRHTMLLFSALSCLVFALMVLVFLTLHHHFSRRQRAEQLLQQANQELTVWVNELEHSNQEVTLLNEMSDLLQSCFTLEEAHSIITRSAQQLFPTESGALFLVDDSQKMLEAMAIWGDNPLGQQIFQPTDCWALRRGQTYQVGDGPSDVRCLHLDNRFSGPYLCVPIMAQNEILGLLHLESASLPAGIQPEATDSTHSLPRNSQKSRYQLAVTVAKHVGLAVANLKLRETLRHQAIRDPLTGLFNRRHMEESLEREILRAARRKASIGLLMIDIDHFKEFNDLYGHAAGDAVLRELASLLQSQTRGEDLACRYGGEEVMLVLPEASLQDALQRAEQLRQAAKHLNVYQGQQAVGAITLSLGVAVFPGHGTTPESLLLAADTALYRAKATGRDRVVAAQAVKQPVESYSSLLQPPKRVRAKVLS
jgi:diguanylate cyclase (GGDEF)-like protein